MVNIDIVDARLRALKEYLAELDTKRSLSLDQMLADAIAYYGIQHLLQLASQVAIDVASHILAADFSKRADQYREVILGLGSEGVLPLEFAQRFAPVAGFRNILVHGYLEVDPKKVHHFLQVGLDDFRAFAGYVVDHLKKTGAYGEA